ncbi:MAG: T9SS type A sorting domain-containing protein [Patescibacteria group bacterium]
MKAVKLFLAVLIFFVPLVLSGQISNQTVGGWKVVGTTGTVTKACSRVVTDTATHGSHSQSFIGVLGSNSSITWEKKYSQTFQKLSRKEGWIDLYTKKMSPSGYTYAFISFGNETGYSIPTSALLILGSGQGFFYPFNLFIDKVPDSFDRVKIEFVFYGADNFEILLDYLFFPAEGQNPRLVIDDFEDTTVPVEKEPTLPNSFKLFQNYPNPSNPTTSIKYEVSSIMNVKLVVYDILGREVAILVNEEKFPGKYEIQFNGSKLSSAQGGLASGTYFYVLRAGNFSETKKMLLVK